MELLHMDNNQSQDKILFSVTEEELQREAKHRIIFLYE